MAYTHDTGVVMARETPKTLTGLVLPNKMIAPVGSAFISLQGIRENNQLRELDTDATMSRLFDSLYLVGKIAKDRRYDIVDELARDIYESECPIGEYDPVLRYRLRSALLAVSAEMMAHFQYAGLYINDTLMYDYVRQFGNKHALLSRRSHATFL